MGIWLNAADTLVTITITPTIAREIGGYSYFGWAVAAYLLGSIVGGAMAGQFANKWGLGRATALGGGVYGLGCLVDSVSPDFLWFLGGRLAQGLGAGWIVALCYVAIGVLFPKRLWPRVFGAVSAIWGAATLLGPLIGGVFAEVGHWRWIFWVFVGESLIFAVAALRMIRSQSPEAARPAAVKLLGVLASSVVLIATAGQVSPSWAAGLVALGVSLLIILLRMNARTSPRLLPRSAGDLTSVQGAGYAAILMTEAAAIGFNVYGPVMVQSFDGASPITAGYMVGAITMGWTVAALVVARATPRWHGRLIRLGGLIILSGVTAGAWTIAYGNVWEVIAAMFLMGSGFGTAWAFLNTRVIGQLGPEERDIGASAVPTAQMLGGAVGAASSNTWANVLGFGHDISTTQTHAAFWLFAAFIPVAGCGALAAWRVGATRHADMG